MGSAEQLAAAARCQTLADWCEGLAARRAAAGDLAAAQSWAQRQDAFRRLSREWQASAALARRAELERAIDESVTRWHLPPRPLRAWWREEGRGEVAGDAGEI